MYKNVGKTIKNFAKDVCIGLSILFILVGIGLIIRTFRYPTEPLFANQALEYGTFEKLLMSLGTMIGGPLLSYGACSLIYGFGEIVDKVCSIEANTKKGLDKE